MRSVRVKVFAALFLLVLCSQGLYAGLLPVNVTVTPDGGNFRWTYAIVLPTDSQIRPGDFFTIYDFGGLVPSSNSQPSDWSFGVTNVGPVPAGVDPQDHPDQPNLTWTYAGAAVPSGQVGLGNFWAVSTFGTSTDSFFTARTHRTSDGRIDTNITETVVPVPGASPPGVPEPGTLLMAALGLPLLGAARLRRGVSRR